MAKLFQAERERRNDAVQKVNSLIINNVELMTAIKELCKECRIHDWENAVTNELVIITRSYYDRNHPKYNNSGEGRTLLTIPVD